MNKLLLMILCSATLSALHIVPGDKCFTNSQIWATPRLAWGANFSCTFPITQGDYVVQFTFQESTGTTLVNSAGQRRFVITANDVSLGIFDVYALAGPNAVTVNQRYYADQDKQLILNFKSLPFSRPAIVSAIDIIPVVIPGGNFCTISYIDDKTLSVCGTCTKLNPCNHRFNNIVYSIWKPAKVTVVSGSGQAYFYVNQNGDIIVGHTMSLTCDEYCTTIAGVIAFPITSIPIGLWVADQDKWVVGFGTSLNGQSISTIVTKNGLQSLYLPWQVEIAVDSAIISMRSPVPANSTDLCIVNSFAMDENYYYVCTSKNTWKRASLNGW